MLSLQQLKLKVSVIQKIFLSEQTLHIQWSVKISLHFQKLDLESNPEFKWLSEVVKTILCLLEMLSLQQLTLRVSVIQKSLLSEQTLLKQWSVKTLSLIHI